MKWSPYFTSRTTPPMNEDDLKDVAGISIEKNMTWTNSSRFDFIKEEDWVAQTIRRLLERSFSSACLTFPITHRKKTHYSSRVCTYPSFSIFYRHLDFILLVRLADIAFIFILTTVEMARRSWKSFHTCWTIPQCKNSAITEVSEWFSSNTGREVKSPLKLNTE